MTEKYIHKKKKKEKEMTEKYNSYREDNHHKPRWKDSALEWEGIPGI